MRDEFSHFAVKITLRNGHHGMNHDMVLIRVFLLVREVGLYILTNHTTQHSTQVRDSQACPLKRPPPDPHHHTKEFPSLYDNTFPNIHLTNDEEHTCAASTSNTAASPHTRRSSALFNHGP
jgi:hypothetical protein